MSNYEYFPKKIVTYDDMAHDLQKWHTQIFAMRAIGTRKILKF